MTLFNFNEFLSSSNFIIGGGFCLLICVVLIPTLIKWLSNSKQAKTTDVDDSYWENDTKAGLKKLKGKKGKTSSNAQVDVSSNSSRSKVTGKQPSATAPAPQSSKDKQVDRKSKTLAKKQSASPLPVDKPAQHSTEVQEEWTVAGVKKKQKNKKPGTSNENLKTKDLSDGQPQEKEDVGIVNLPNGGVVADKTKDKQKECLVSEEISTESVILSHSSVPVTSSNFEKSELQTSATYEPVITTESDSKAFKIEELSVAKSIEDTPETGPAGNETKPKNETGSAGNETKPKNETGSAGNETKPKKNAKKKKSKVSSEGNQELQGVSAVDKEKKTDNSRKDDDISRKSEPLPETVFEKTESKIMKPTSLADVDHGSSNKVLSRISESLGPSASGDAILNASTCAESPVDAMVNSSLSVGNALAFDELGLQESLPEFGQPATKKKKKVRRDF